MPRQYRPVDKKTEALNAQLRRAKDYGKLLKAEGRSSDVQKQMLEKAQANVDAAKYADKPWLKKSKGSQPVKGDGKPAGKRGPATAATGKRPGDERSDDKKRRPGAPQHANNNDERSRAIADSRKRRAEHGRVMKARTSKGQPMLVGRMAHLLDQAHKSVERTTRKH